MIMKLSKNTFEIMIAEDIEWLHQQPDTCWRRHILALLAESVDMYYPSTIADYCTFFDKEKEHYRKACIEKVNALYISDVGGIDADMTIEALKKAFDDG